MNEIELTSAEDRAPGIELLVKWLGRSLLMCTDFPGRLRYLMGVADFAWTNSSSESLTNYGYIDLLKEALKYMPSLLTSGEIHLIEVEDDLVPRCISKNEYPFWHSYDTATTYVIRNIEYGLMLAGAKPDVDYTFLDLREAASPLVKAMYEASCFAFDDVHLLLAPRWRRSVPAEDEGRP
jgi:hypothetical protein